MSKMESELRDHALSLIHQDYILVEKQIQGLSGKLSAELNLISQSAHQIPQSINESLKYIADAIEEAEKTASNLSQEARTAIQAIKDSEIEAIRREVLVGLSAELAKTQEVAKNIRESLLSYPDALRPETPIWPIATLSAAVMAAIIACGFFGWKMYQQNAELYNDAIRVHKTYEEQQKVIQTLPPEYRKKFTLE
ncbi:hypothetical protein [Rahnella perminowiae]|uniref:hypothetical protein n=1 Tax=Rahnella perminowiae TaxID=2816244 RepID=UPI00215BB35C|nr:hypothetical protein [Rahnella perminowiae]MCR8998664.1 hypothetical protein [Rahnella perminowiae]MCR8998721.1 hypothetical protein [Rahnella perminowiae]